jgi:putative transposase
MRVRDSIFDKLLKPIDRRQFAADVDHFNADAYDKTFTSWDHLAVLIYAQLSGADSLRGIELGFNAAARHYRLELDPIARSTLSDANARRPVQVFARTFERLAGQADRRTRQDGAEMVRLIDASPIPLGKVCEWAKSNGRLRGMKMHVVYDPHGDVPHHVEITPANINDIEVGRRVALDSGTTYVFDKGYCRFDWWRKINDGGAFFVTRPKTNMRLRAIRCRPVQQTIGDGFTIIDDAEVRLVSKGDSQLPIPLRRIRLRRDNGDKLTLITNDLLRSAVEIAALYKLRWQIELLFRWIKQHLEIAKFLGRNPNAIRLQILAAMIAYLLLRLAALANRVAILSLRLAELVRHFLFARRTLAALAKLLIPKSARRPPTRSPAQLAGCYE